MNIDLKRYQKDILKAISDLVKIPTVYHAATVSPEMPYGKYVYEGYTWLKQKALEDGFEVLEYDGHALAIRIKEVSSHKRVDIVSHVDVVAPGEGWRDNPFSGNLREGFIYGRGTQDMKGTLILTYYALKLIKDNNLPYNKEIRIVIGCDEERTMNDIRYYLKQAGEPEFAFTPDGKFPFSLGEKGALMWHIEGKMDTIIEELEGGVQCNVVSPVAYATIKDRDKDKDYFTLFKIYLNEMVLQREIKIDSESSQNEITFTGVISGKLRKYNDYIRITVFGKAAHASMPEKGLNATVQLLGFINGVTQDKLADTLYHIFADYNGRGADIAYDIPPMGKLTFNLGLLKIKENTVMADVDCRYPYGVSADVLTEKLKKGLGPLKVSLPYDDKPTMAASDSPHLKILLDTYREVMNDYSEPIISGGVTYSKVIKNCVAFGPMKEDSESLAHQANERLSMEKIDQLFEIYAKTMIRLAE